MIRIVDENGNITERPYTTEEIEENKKLRAKYETEQKELKAKEKLREIAVNKLIDLGLTEEEVKAFLD